MFRLRKASDPFFTAFASHAQVRVRAAGLLRQLFARPADVVDLKEQITLLEHEGDELTRGAITRLRSQWITALDRPDIHLLATRLDDVLDIIEAIAERILLSPVLGLILGGVTMRLLMLLFGKRWPRWVDRTFRCGQLLSAALYSLGHGGNDVQKTMGIITAACLLPGT